MDSTQFSARVAPVALLVLLVATPPARAVPPVAPAVEIRFDPALTLDAAERRDLTAYAAECLESARRILNRPASRSYFQRTYRLDPETLLAPRSLTIVLRTFRGSNVFPPVKTDVQVGAYIFGERRIALNVNLLRSARIGSTAGRWKEYVASVIVHELAHLADFLDNGLNDDAGIGRWKEEGAEAQRACGCLYPLPAEPRSLARRRLLAPSSGPGQRAPARRNG